jgi:hypothetical protein
MSAVAAPPPATHTATYEYQAQPRAVDGARRKYRDPNEVVQQPLSTASPVPGR